MNGFSANLAAINNRDRISIDPSIRSGKPCVRGTRIAVADVLDYLGGGMTLGEVKWAQRDNTRLVMTENPGNLPPCQRTNYSSVSPLIP